MLHFNIKFETSEENGKLLVAFYDPRFTGDASSPAAFTPFGQFIARYYAETILKHVERTNGGLSLQGGQPEWTVSSVQMREIANTIKRAEQ